MHAGEEMVAVSNKELLCWYLITLKLKETFETNLPKPQPEPTASFQYKAQVVSKFEPLPTRRSLPPSLPPELQESPEPWLTVWSAPPLFPAPPPQPESPESPESPETPESPEPPERPMTVVLARQWRPIMASPQPESPDLSETRELSEPPVTSLLARQWRPIMDPPLLPSPPQPPLGPRPIYSPLKWPPSPPLNSPWVIPISEKLEQGRQYEAGSRLWGELSIYRVPKPVRDVDESAYTPQIVAVGPYHRGQSHLCDMERHKWRALHRALEREGHNFSTYLEACRSLEFRARACYEASLSISTNDLVESLVIDAIFILELFRGVYNKEGFRGLGYDPKDPVFTVPGIMLSLQRDMIKLENQLPFFVLDCILALQEGYSPDLLARLALNFFSYLIPANTCRPSGQFFDSIKYASEAVHCLDFFRLNLLLEGPEKPRGTEEVYDMRFRNHSVTELRAAGFGFRPVESVRFWDIKFKNGVLHIPSFPVHDTTKSLFLNLIAFEQYHLKGDRHISTYVMFMDELINSEEDVSFLHHKRIIGPYLGNDKEVADLFNLLSKDVLFNMKECYLSDLFKQMDIYYNHRWNTWRASLVQKYFSNPWAFISLVAAIVLLLLTFGQTLYSIYGYYKPN